jgi:hypothetical protein
MAAEKSCVHPFIRRIQAVLKETGSLGKAFGEIHGYQGRAKKIYRVDTHLIHALVLGTFSLAVLVLYEYLRYRGIPLPDSRSFIGRFMPAKNRSDEIILSQINDDKKHESMGKEVSSQTRSGDNESLNILESQRSGGGQDRSKASRT